MVKSELYSNNVIVILCYYYYYYKYQLTSSDTSQLG